jgi:hypothetical protein
MKTADKSQKAIRTSELRIGALPFEFDDGDAGEDSQVAIPSEIHLIPIGQWEHDLYGPILITASDIAEFANNFENKDIRKGVFITAGHEGMQELPAAGWISKVEARADGLWGTVEWNEMGKEILADKQYKFFSPEFYRDYEDPQTHSIYRNVLTGGALTKSPYFKELEAVVFSEAKIRKTFSNQPTMDINELLAKDVATLSDEEKAFLNEHKAELTDEQKTALGDVIVAETEEVAETPEEKTARETAEGDANEVAGLNRDGSAKEEAAAAVEPEAPTAEQIQASEKVTMSAVELAHLRSMADKGVQAFKELASKKLDGAVSALMFTESNKAGKFLPKEQTTLRSFMESLNATQLTQFSTLVTAIPSTQVFGEVGAAGAVEPGTFAEVEILVNAKIKASEAAGGAMKYSDALKEVMAENKGLEERYDAGLPSARKAVKA